MEFKEEDTREELAHAIGGLVPRDDQIDTAFEIVQWLSEDADKGKVVECPTGCGKTLIAQMVIHWLVNNTDFTIAFLVSRTELLLQTKAAMERSFGKGSVNITQGSKHEVKASARVRVAMQQTIESKIRNSSGAAVVRSIEEADVVFIDEAHQTYYASFIENIQSHGGRVVGLSATPDDWRLCQWFEREKIMGPPQVDLEDATPRILATPVMLSYKNEDTLDRAMEGIFGEEERAKVRFGLIRKTIVKEIEQAEMRIEDMRGVQGLKPLGRNLRWLVKVGRRAHAIELAEHLSESGVPAKAFISGKGGGSKKQIDAIFAGKSPYRMAVVVHRFSVGYDHPGIQGLVLTTETIYPAFVQSVGRVLRTGYPPQKDQAYILDMGGNWRVHGNKYLERRDHPETHLPMPPEKRERGPLDGEPGSSARRDAEELGDMVVLTLPGIKKTDYARMDKAVLFAYCAVEAYAHINSEQYQRFNSMQAYSDMANQKRVALKRALTNYWFITGQNIIAFGASDERKREMANAIITANPEALKVWETGANLPEPVLKRLMKARRKFSRQRRAAA